MNWIIVVRRIGCAKHQAPFSDTRFLHSSSHFKRVFLKKRRYSLYMEVRGRSHRTCFCIPLHCFPLFFLDRCVWLLRSRLTSFAVSHALHSVLKHVTQVTRSLCLYTLHLIFIPALFFCILKRRHIQYEWPLKLLFPFDSYPGRSSGKHVQT